MFGIIGIKNAAVIHPLVRDIYLKPSTGGSFDGSRQNALVIETNFGKQHRADDTNDRSFDTYLEELLMDLPRIKSQAQANVGNFDRICIKLN